MMNKVNTNINVREGLGNKDPDKFSKILIHYHYLLWNKGPLSGLKEVGNRLEFTKDGKTYFLRSDSIMNPYHENKECSHLVKQIKKDIWDEYWKYDCSIGGYIIYPGQKEGGMTINQARGCNPLIKDRFDLTLDCIRKYYLGETSPLYEDLKRYKWFFDLFKDFKGYVEFFLLQDLVNQDGTIKFFLNTQYPVPKTVDEELLLLNKMKEFCRTRNKRIELIK